MTHEIVSMHAHYQSGDSDVHAYLSRPLDSGPFPAVVLVHAYMGMGAHYRDLTRRLAKQGFVVIAPDLYHGESPTSHVEAAFLKTSLDLTKAVQEMLDAIPYLRSLPYVSSQEGVLGFCMSGGLALIAAARSDDLQAAVAYYPSIFPDPEILADIHCPVLLHYGTADDVTPASEIDNLRGTLENLAVDYDYYEYEDAPHAFLNDSYEQYYHEEAATESWKRTVSFFEANLTN